MRVRASLLARFLTAYLVLFGAAAMGAVWAEDAAPVANHTDAEAAPIDTSVATQRPSHFRRELKSRDAKKYTIAHPSGNSGDRRIWMRGATHSIVRNAIGLHIDRTSADII